MAITHAAKCTAYKKDGSPCPNPAVKGYAVCRMHGAGSPHVNKPGGKPVTHGRYSKLKTESLRKLIEEFEADPDPLNILPELAAARALFADFIDRYEQFTAALVAWHNSYPERPLSPQLCVILQFLIEEYGTVAPGVEQDDEGYSAEIATLGKLVEQLRNPGSGKPVQVLDISDAYRIVSEVTKIAERIEKARNVNAISRPDLYRLMGEMARVVQTYVEDPAVIERIRTGWIGLRV